MMFRRLQYLDAVILFLAVLLPKRFPSASYSLFSLAFGSAGPQSAAAYCIAILIVCFGCSVFRHWHGAHTPSNSAVAMNVLVVAVGSIVLFSSYHDSIDAPTNVGGYAAYVLSILFCAGVGYCLAGLTLAIPKHFRRN